MTHYFKKSINFSTYDLSSENRRDWNNIFKILKEKKKWTINPDTICCKDILKDWEQNKYEKNLKADQDFLKKQKISSSGGGGLVTKLCPTLVTPWTIAHKAPLSMGFPIQILQWVAISFSWDLLPPGIKCRSLASPALWADSSPTEPSGKPIIR